jgi:hypothetical protein
MDLHVDDAGFVRAPLGACYAVLTDLSGWGAWWPGARTRPVHMAKDAVEVAVGTRLRGLRLRLTAGGWRHEAGFRMAVTGDLVGRAEFWLEPGWDGTVVHHVLAATPTRGDGRRVRAAYRSWLRRGLWGLKDELEAAVRVDAGLVA